MCVPRLSVPALFPVPPPPLGCVPVLGTPSNFYVRPGYYQVITFLNSLMYPLRLMMGDTLDFDWLPLDCLIFSPSGLK